jgi:hypothetical protein
MAVDLSKGILPIFIVQPGPPEKLLDFCGTGFLIADGVLITCWHVLKAELPDGHHYGVALKDGTETKSEVFYLANIQQDLNGSDLATANVNLNASIGLTLAKDDISLGADIWTFGYPLTDVKSLREGHRFFQLNPRLMRGYMMRTFNNDHPEYRSVFSYELNIPAPQGISGAPLVKHDSTEVVGVIYGNNDVGVIEEFAHIDEKTGKRHPELQRIVSFGLAHHLNNLAALNGAATNDLPLSEYISRNRPKDSTLLLNIPPAKSLGF